ncbi:TonB-dependent receptor [Sphingomonas oligophenolica]|uniref:TonB-dependent receptor n=1 Tax=Sphingomonas oligophenolica TaxID=301154 RepID=A0ABU9XXD1_9SPHN
MKKFELLAASAIILLHTAPAMAQAAPQTPQTAPTPVPENAPQEGDIVVTAQRQSERLQDVPIAVSAFTAAALDRQQIVNPTALQQSLPNITFTKTNFTGSSFTIRGIGDLCTGTSCDSATAIHVNDMPLVSTRLFESEFFDLERVEVLRGPQGTLFGRNATSGVVNFITAKPDLSGIHATGEAEYGNYNSKKAKAMLNIPLSDTIGVRVAGLYLKRDGYTENLYNDSKIDNRDLYSIRGTLSWEPDSNTRLDLMGYYFHERDNRSRIQKQMCHRDPTGILGCLPDKLAYQTTNGNSTLSAIQSSSQFLGIASASAVTGGGGTPAQAAAVAAIYRSLALGSIYGTDVFANAVNPTNNRVVNVDYTPTYFADEEQYQAKFFHDFGRVSLNITGGYARNSVDSRTDYTNAVESPLTNNPGLQTLAAYAAAPGAAFPAGVNPFTALAAKLIPNGPAGGVCQSDATHNAGGVYSGASVGCFQQSLDFDRSKADTKQWSVEGHIDSHFDGMFNFLLGGIYLDQKVTDNDYYVNAFGLDYASGLVGTIPRLLGAVPTNVISATPFYDNDEAEYRLKSYGIFGETYFQFNDKLKLTVGLRYNHDSKYLKARTTYLVDSNGENPFLPYGGTDLSQALNAGALDFDVTHSGNQAYTEDRVAFSRLTGRAVLDYKITPNNMVYVSYSRGYKSGGINPPLSPIFAVPTTFEPEKVDAFEIGSKNSFMHGALHLNLTGFYYKYNNLQLARIVARTAVNDNVSADIYGLEAEAVINPIPAFTVNANFSYLHSKVTTDKFIANPRDPSGGRSDAVIIKDITNASNCAVIPKAGANAAAVNAYVGAVNSSIGLAAPTPIPGTNTTGAYSSCSALAATAAAPPAALDIAFGLPVGTALPFTVLGDGVAVNIRGNQLPQAPTYKFAVGAQYVIDFGNGMTLVPRVDLNYTGGSFASIFNQNIDRMQGYEVINAQVQLNSRDDRWYIRGFVQNLTGNDAITGQYVTDQSSGLFTNIFTIEPRRYGIAAGFKF